MSRQVQTYALVLYTWDMNTMPFRTRVSSKRWQTYGDDINQVEVDAGLKHNERAPARLSFVKMQISRH